jgi:DNA-binding GntR family transcriptional regulator
LAGSGDGAGVTSLSGLDTSSSRRRMSLAEEVAAGLRELILSGALVPGNRVGEMEVAERFSTSQGPVREAFVLLRQEGLLVSLPRRGTFVSAFSIDEARSVYEIRLRLEPYAIERAIPCLRGEDVEAFAGDVEAMREAAAVRDLRAMTAHDMRFHGRLYELSGSELAQAIWRLIDTKVQTFIAVAGAQYFAIDEIPAIAEMHATLLHLIEARDADALQEEVRKQLLMIWERITEASGQQDDLALNEEAS